MTERDAASSELTDAQIGNAYLRHAEGIENATGRQLAFARAVIAADRALRQPAPVQVAAYKDSTPSLRVGDSSFESWFESYSAAHKGDKQRARDAYAAGMGDPLVQVAGDDALTALATQSVEIARLTAELAAPDALAVHVMRAQILELTAERDKYTRMFNAACVDLGLINESLCLDPNDGGAEPIIGAIEELTAERDALKQALCDIKEMTDAENSESFRCDDGEGCLDAVFAAASAATAKESGK